MSGMATGQPAGASAQSVSSGALQAMGTGTAPSPQASPPLAPPVAPSIPMAGGESFTPASTPVDAPTTSPPMAPTTGGGVPVAPAVMTGGSWSAPAAPVAGGPVAPAGPLPAYGSDLRPPVVAPPAVASAPTAPVSGAAVAFRTVVPVGGRANGSSGGTGRLPNRSGPGRREFPRAGRCIGGVDCDRSDCRRGLEPGRRTTTPTAHC